MRGGAFCEGTDTKAGGRSREILKKAADPAKAESPLGDMICEKVRTKKDEKLLTTIGVRPRV